MKELQLILLDIAWSLWILSRSSSYWILNLELLIGWWGCGMSAAFVIRYLA